MVAHGDSDSSSCRPEEKSAQQYWDECLSLVDVCDELGFTQVRTVEHYFEPYGGYSPPPHVFLTAASQRTSRARRLTGAQAPARRREPRRDSAPSRRRLGTAGLAWATTR